MVSSRTLTAFAGFVGSLLTSVALWWYFDTFVFFLLIPFVPFLFREPVPERRECPRCGFGTTDEEYEYCPRDGQRLETTRDS